MIRTGPALVCALLAAFAPSASGARPPVALTATPTHVRFAGSGLATIAVTNPGRAPIVVDATRAGFALDRRGRPRIAARDGDGSWLTLRPRRLILGPGETGSLFVAAHLSRGLEPGDHDALVLLTTRPRPAAGVAVRMRIGVVVVLQAAGRIVRRLELGSLTVRHRGAATMLELVAINRGNVTETLRPGRVGLALRGDGRIGARLAPRPRELRPRSRGIVQFAYHGRVHGLVTAQVRVGQQLRRTYRIRL